MAQALLFINGDLLNKKVSGEGGMVDRLVKAGKPNTEVLDELYWTSFGRAPRPQERASDLSAIQRALAAPESTPPSDPKTPRPMPADRLAAARRKAFEDMLWVLLNSKEFLFNH